MSDARTIKPCPFPSCGSESVQVICSGSCWFVECNECGAMGPCVTDGDDNEPTKAIDAWNAALRKD